MTKFLLFISFAAGVYYFVEGNNIFDKISDEEKSEYGFVKLPRLKNIKSDSVIIFAPKNCTKEAARRADQLADDLKQHKISVLRSNRASFENFDISMQSKVDGVMRGQVPIVIIDNWGKANPTLEEVVSEYNSIYE